MEAQRPLTWAKRIFSPPVLRGALALLVFSVVLWGLTVFFSMPIWDWIIAGISAILSLLPFSKRRASKEEVSCAEQADAARKTSWVESRSSKNTPKALLNNISGHYSPARQYDSPNRNERPSDERVDSIVLHCISLPRGNYTTNAVIDLFMNRLDCSEDPSFKDLEGVKVSAHFFIRRTGEIFQFVNTHQAAWHAGVSNYAGRDAWNKFSVGIEMEGVDDAPFEAEQYNTLIHTVEWLLQTHPALYQGYIVGHEDIAPGRKTDPGTGFDWMRLYHAVCRLGATNVHWSPSVRVEPILTKTKPVF